MIDVPSRELRNDVSAVLRRVEQGESMRITVSGRPVAQLLPLAPRPRTIATAALLAALERGGTDHRLLADLAEALPDSTDDAVGSRR